MFLEWKCPKYIYLFFFEKYTKWIYHRFQVKHSFHGKQQEKRVANTDANASHKIVIKGVRVVTFFFTSTTCLYWILCSIKMKKMTYYLSVWKILLGDGSGFFLLLISTLLLRIIFSLCSYNLIHFFPLSNLCWTVS